jgi:hypothetical protein
MSSADQQTALVKAGAWAPSTFPCFVGGRPGWSAARWRVNGTARFVALRTTASSSPPTTTCLRSRRSWTRWSRGARHSPRSARTQPRRRHPARRGEYPNIANVVLGGLAIFVAIERFGPYAF